MFKFVSATTRVTAKTQAKAKSAWARILTAGLLSAFAAKPALADLPTVEGPSSSGTGTGLMGTLSGHVQDGLVLGGLCYVDSHSLRLQKLALLPSVKCAMTVHPGLNSAPLSWSGL